jgi:hypothetical protein
VSAIDNMLAKVEEAYDRSCTDCNAKFKLPTLRELLDGEVRCSCGQLFDVDSDDRNFFIAMLLARVERLERRTSGPFDGLGL